MLRSINRSHPGGNPNVAVGKPRAIRLVMHLQLVGFGIAQRVAPFKLLYKNDNLPFFLGGGVTEVYGAPLRLSEEPHENE